MFSVSRSRGRIVVGDGGSGTGAGVEIEVPAGDVDQFLRPRVAHGVLAPGEDREQPLIAEDVPRIDERAAVDPAIEQALDLEQGANCVRCGWP